MRFGRNFHAYQSDKENIFISDILKWLIQNYSPNLDFKLHSPLNATIIIIKK